MNIKYPAIGVCGLSCGLCPRYYTEGESRCFGCKTESRMAAGCQFITCAVKRRSIEFCWDCQESKTCEKWRKHRAAGMQHDSFKCYQKLEEDIAFILKHGVEEFDEAQKVREKLLSEMLQEFNEGRSKSHYCIAATVINIEELQEALSGARAQSGKMQLADRAKKLHAELDSIAAEKNYLLKLRK